jgi:hypothetical protein
MITLMRLEWGADNPSLRQMFAAKMMPDATKEQVDSFNEMQQKQLRLKARHAITRPPEPSMSPTCWPG